MQKKLIVMATLVLFLTGCMEDDSEGSYQNDPGYQEWRQSKDEDSYLDGRAAADDERLQRDAELDAIHFGQVDCDMFVNQSEAQRFFIRHDGPSRDPYFLDGDADGVACEWN